MEKICVITGGTSGIGKCTAEAMVKKGYTVYELSRREAGNPGMYHIPTDVTDPKACQRAIDAVISQAGRIDVMINNAGFGISGAIEFTPIEQAKKQLDVNFFGMVNMNHAVIPVMRRQGFGRIVNLSSVAGMEKDETTGMKPEQAGAFVCHVATRKGVRPVNTIGLSYKFFCVLQKLLPAKTLNWLVGVVYAR